MSARSTLPRLPILALLGGCVGALYETADAASFDCSAASLPAEKLICGDSHLSALDDELGHAYSKAMQDPVAAPKLRSDQRLWLAQRNKCTTASCLTDSFRQRIAELAPQQSANTSPSAPANQERIEIGNHAGESAFIVSKSGVGTAHATIEVLMDWPRELQACADEYLTYDSGYKDQQGYARCVDFNRKTFKGTHHLSARANCETGEMLGFNETQSRVYAGQTRDVADGKVFYIHAFDYEGFRVPDYSATNTQTDGNVFRKLCPQAFTGAPRTDLPLLDLRSDCQAQLPEAEELVSESGALHVLNIHVIDAWDIKNEGDTWFSASCSAHVLLNNSSQTRLEYMTAPLHGKYFLKARIVQ